jgi:hypothetical protein
MVIQLASGHSCIQCTVAILSIEVKCVLFLQPISAELPPSYLNRCRLVISGDTWSSSPGSAQIPRLASGVLL